MASNYTYKYIIDEYGQIVYPRTVLSAVDIITANGIQVDHDTISIRFATKEQIRNGAYGQVVSADGLKEAIAAYSDTLYIAGGGIAIQGGTIFAKAAPINSLIKGTPNEHDVVTNANLNGALGVGRALDTTMLPFNNNSGLSITYYTEIIDGVTDSCMKFSGSVSSGTWYVHEWTPANPGYIEGREYMIMCDAKIVTGSATIGIGNRSPYNSQNQPIVDENGVAIQRSEYLMTSDWTRLANRHLVSGTGTGIYFQTKAAGTVDIRVKHFFVFDVTGLSDSAIYALAISEHPDDIFGRYLVKNESVCPWMETRTLSGTPVIVQPGISYKLTATDGAVHTINVPTLPSNTYGEDTYITIVLDNTSAIQAVQPLVVMDALKPNAANNCVIKYRDGYARLYVNDTDYGYIVTVSGSGTTNGTLYYGLFSRTDDYILFSHATDEADCVVSTGNANIPTTSAATRVITGNGKNVTTANFNNTQLKTGKSLTFDEIAIKNVNITAGTVYADNSTINNVTLTTGRLELNHDINLSGILYYNGGNLILNNTTIDGAGSLNYGSTITAAVTSSTPLSFSNISINGASIQYTPIVCTGSSLSFINCQVSNFTNSQTARVNGPCYGAFLMYNVSTGSLMISNCVFSNIVGVGNLSGASVNTDVYGGLYTAANTTIIDTSISGCTATYGGTVQLSSNDKTLTVINSIFQNNFVRYQGGVLASLGAGRIIINGSTFANNYSNNHGGAIFVKNCDINNTLIKGNTSGANGGGIYINSGSSCFISGSTFHNNKAAIAAVCIYGTSVTITNTDFSYNYSSSQSGAMYISGQSTVTCTACHVAYNYANGADVITIVGSGTKGFFNNCIIEGNTSYNHGGMYVNQGGSVEMTNCIVRNNHARSSDVGGVCGHVNASFTLTGCTIAYNRALATYGAGVHAAQTTTGTCVDCLIVGNTANTYGGGVEMNWNDGKMYLTRCVISGNVAGNGQGNGGDFRGSNTQLYLTDCTFDDNQDIWVGTTSSNNCKISIAGSNVFRAAVNGPYASFTINSGSVIDLRRNNVPNAIVGATITTLGMITVIGRTGQARNHLARAVTTGSTITNMGEWLPSPTRLVIPANTTASFRGYNLSNNTVNETGGGVRAIAGNINVDIHDTTIANNNASGNRGSGIYAYSSSVTLSIYNCLIDRCVTYPIMADYYSTINMTGCTVSNCTTNYDIVMALAYGHINAFDCLITDNKNSASGDMAIGAHQNGECNITGCTVSYNWANHCAGYHLAQGAYGVATDCLIKGNTATTGGGGAGMWLTGATMSLVGCTFEGNVAPNGAAVCCNNSNCYLNITDCTFKNNQDVYCYTSNCQMKLYGTNKFKALVSCTNGCITINDGSTVNLSGNVVDNAVIGGTIAVLGSTLAVIGASGGLHQYPARTVTGSTITKEGAWLPVPRLLFNTDNEVATLTGPILNNYIVTTANDADRAIRVYGTNSVITLNNVEVCGNTTGDFIGLILMANVPSTTTINGGKFNSNNNQGGNTALFYVSSAATVSMSGVQMTDNVTHRSCVLCESANTVVNVSASTFARNYSYVDTTLFARSSGKLNILDCLVTGNTASGGGDTSAILAYTGATVTVSRSTITENICTHNFNAGVGAYSGSRTEVYNCYIANNRAGGQGSDLFCGANSIMTVSGSTITGNLGTSPISIQDNSTLSFTGGNEIRDNIGISASSSQIPKLNFSGTNRFTGTITGSYGYLLTTISAGAVLNFTGNANTNVILGGTITVQGNIIVIDTNGVQHTVTANNYTKITNMGVAS